MTTLTVRLPEGMKNDLNQLSREQTRRSATLSGNRSGVIRCGKISLDAREDFAFCRGARPAD
ncbi:MAG: hypothetical protein U5L00_07820 [Desulfovermiculus sp.]|nr:hypothetical protein [Desulfovermiculus sp.]